MPVVSGFFGSQLQRCLGTWRKRHPCARAPVPRSEELDDLASQRVHADVEQGAVLHADSDKQVLSADCRVPKLPRCFMGRDDRIPGGFIESLEHVCRAIIAMRRF